MLACHQWPHLGLLPPSRRLGPGRFRRFAVAALYERRLSGHNTFVSPADSALRERRYSKLNHYGRSRALFRIRRIGPHPRLRSAGPAVYARRSLRVPWGSPLSHVVPSLSILLCVSVAGSRHVRAELPLTTSIIWRGTQEPAGFPCFSPRTAIVFVCDSARTSPVSCPLPPIPSLRSGLFATDHGQRTSTGAEKQTTDGIFTIGGRPIWQERHKLRRGACAP
jgi:hypothetical protein